MHEAKEKSLKKQKKAVRQRKAAVLIFQIILNEGVIDETQKRKRKI